jgi:ABC-type cobalamin/Fe3+-siderophores transport system ATPase subunit
MANTAQPTAVALGDATVAFRVAGDRVYTAVEKANLSVAHGEFVAIVGPTGCGKSTLLNVAAGLLKPASGSVKIFDQPPSGLRSRARRANRRCSARKAGSPRWASARSATVIRTCSPADSASASALRRC